MVGRRSTTATVKGAEARVSNCAAAIAPDYTVKLWPNSYAGRRNAYDYEGGEPANLPPAGYIWTNALAAGISLRGSWEARRSSIRRGRPPGP